jgi:aerotaxis receptor
MRNNVPVTGREHELSDDATLMSTTDAQSYITYANSAFVEISGFSAEELEGQPHNVVRHPDMPQEAFADMWATLKGGEPWTAIVKNRCKNGDHYWVRANATPVVRGGRPIGYMSVRTKPSREEISAAQALYADFREGRAGNRAFHKGLVVRKGWLGFTSALKTMSVRWRIRTALIALLAMLVGAAAAAGQSGAGLGVFGAAACVACVLASLWLEAQIAGPLERLREHALEVASGQGRQLAEAGRVDEIGMTLRTVNRWGLCSAGWSTTSASKYVTCSNRSMNSRKAIST